MNFCASLLLHSFVLQFFYIIVTYNCKVLCDANYLMLWRFYDRLSTLERVQEHSQACDLVNLSISHSLRTLCIPEVFEPSYLRGFDWMDASITYSEYASLQRPSPGKGGSSRATTDRKSIHQPLASHEYWRKRYFVEQLLARLATKMDTTRYAYNPRHDNFWNRSKMWSRRTFLFTLA